MKQNIHTFIMSLLALLAIYLYFLSAQSISPQLQIKEIPKLNNLYEEKEALAYLNHLRVGAGLVKFTSHPKLERAAQNHAKYLTEHLIYGHKEDANLSGFTGEYASNRITFTGYATPQVIENVSTRNKNYKESIDGLFAAIYHRLAFLDFRSDSIGIGINQNPCDKEQTAFVYNMSLQSLENLYAKKIKITQKNLKQALESNKDKNHKVVIYPFDKQSNIPPAFFDELPDPLPQHKVSGFPISISFNAAHYKDAKLVNFQLFNEEGVQILETLKMTHETDQNKKLKQLDFVLFPLKRLKWNSRYHVKFLAIVDKKLIEKNWEFTTQKFTKPFHEVHQDNEEFEVQVNQPHIFYFPPKSKIDLLNSIKYPAHFDIEFIDKNTIKLTALSLANKKSKLSIGKHQINIYVQK